MIKSWKMKCSEHVARMQNGKLISCGLEMWPPSRRAVLSRTSYFITSLVT
jgi:hypothetical protein